MEGSDGPGGGSGGPGGASAASSTPASSTTALCPFKAPLLLWRGDLFFRLTLDDLGAPKSHFEELQRGSLVRHALVIAYTELLGCW